MPDESAEPEVTAVPRPVPPIVAPHPAAGSLDTVGDQRRAAFRLGYRPELDGLRGVAITLVLIAHAREIVSAQIGRRFLGANQGVDLFFVLSGFLITSLLIEEYKRNSRVSFKGFYLRRFYRLIPSLVFILACYIPWWISRGLNLSYLLKAYAFILLYISNYARIFNENLVLRFQFGQTWSLSIEEQYYLLFFPLMVLAIKYVRPTRRIIIFLAIIFVLAAAWRAWLNTFTNLGSFSSVPLYYRTDTRLDVLLIGPIIALLAHSNLPLRAILRWIGPVALVVAAVFVSIARYDASWMFTWGYAVTSIVWGAVVLWLVLVPINPMGHFLRLAPIRWLGLISYELYLCHLAIFTEIGLRWRNGWLALGVATAASVGVAAFTYYVVARPFRRRKERNAKALRG